MQPLRRRRPALSCITCRRRKIKCDRKSPCSHCVSSRSQCDFRAYRDEPASSALSQQPTPSTSTSSPRAPASPPRELISTATRTPNEELRLSGAPRQSIVVRRDAPHVDSVHGLPEACQQDLSDVLRRLQRLEDISAPSNDPKRLHAEARRGIDSEHGVQDTPVTLSKTRVSKYQNQSMDEMNEV